MKVGDFAIGRGWVTVAVGVIADVRDPGPGYMLQARIVEHAGHPGRWWNQVDVLTFETMDEAKSTADELRKLARRASRF